MKKIMFMMPTLGGGGAEKILVDILNNIDKNKFDITLILLRKSGVHFSRLNSDINTKYILKKDNFFLEKIQKIFIKYLPKLYYKLYINEKYDIEIAYLEGLATNLISNSTNKLSKKISWVHCDMSKYNWTQKYYKKGKQKISYDKFDEIIFVSDKCKDGFENTFNIENVRKKVIYNPIINEEIIEKSKMENVIYNKFTIVAIGSLSKVKGFDRLIESYYEIIKKYDVDLKIIGEGIERTNLENLINKYNLQENVELLGYLKNPYPYIKAANLIISSSHSEAYPTVLLESIVLGKAILATNVDGNNEVLDYGEIGILCEDSKDGIIDSLKFILENKDIIRKYEIKSYNKSKELDYKKRIREVENLFN